MWPGSGGKFHFSSLNNKAPPPALVGLVRAGPDLKGEGVEGEVRKYLVISRAGSGYVIYLHTEDN